MKKLLLGLAMTLGTLTFAQYQNNGWGNGNYENGGYYGNNDQYINDDYYFPDDYYYDFPRDYYADNYYQSYYNDYRNSIVGINWHDFFRMHRLSSWQVQQIIMLNDMHSSYGSWNSYYRHNPDRWYYDRFYSLRQIMGPQIFIVFQNNYYRGYSPIAYFQNYRRDYYMPKYRVMPRYRNMNVNIYKVDRSRFYDTHGNKYGWSQTRNPHNPGGFREVNSTNTNGGFRNSSSGVNTGGSLRNTTSVRNGDTGAIRNSPAPRNNPNLGEMRSSTSGTRLGTTQTPRTSVQNSVPAQATPPRQISSPRTGGEMRSGNDGVRSSQRSTAAEAGSSQGTRTGNTGSRGGGLR